MGTICFVYAAFLAGIALLVPDTGWTGRLAYVGVAGTMGFIGLFLWLARRRAARALVAAQGNQT